MLPSLLQEDGISKEIIIAEAGSTDGSLDYLVKLQRNHSNIRIYPNREKHLSQAYNKLIPLCKSKYIAILSAHAIYPEGYIRNAIEFLSNNSEYALVGGPIIHKGRSFTGKSIAYCMSSVFGMGDSAFRTKFTDCDTDSVPFPVYKKQLFDSCGKYDEELLRNQDEDFHYRVIYSGFKIKMLKSLTATYFVRESYKSVISQFYQYGLYKPLVMRKNNYKFHFRHFIPSLFILYLISVSAAAFYDTSHILLAIPLFIYLIYLLYFSLKGFSSVFVFLLHFITFPLIHLSYGAGMLIGFNRYLKSSDK